MSRRLSPDDEGVSEVIGYILGFVMAFILLVLSLYAFSLIAKQTSEKAAHAEFRDVANRVSAAVLDAVDIGNQRVGSSTNAASSTIVYSRVLYVPTRVAGHHYTLTLSPGQVEVENLDGTIVETATTFNLQIGACSSAAAVCQLSGTGDSNDGEVKVHYEYRSAGAGSTCNTVPVNCVTIS